MVPVEPRAADTVISLPVTTGYHAGYRQAAYPALTLRRGNTGIKQKTRSDIGEQDLPFLGAWTGGTGTYFI